MDKNFKLSKEQIKDLATGYGACLATDHITIEGKQVGFMYREEVSRPEDSGWRFFSGEETQEYADDTSNTKIYDVNTIANYDPAIIPFLNSPPKTAFGREGDSFIEEEF